MQTTELESNSGIRHNDEEKIKDNEQIDNLQSNIYNNRQLVLNDSKSNYLDERLEALVTRGATPNELMTFYNQIQIDNRKNYATKAGFKLSFTFTIAGAIILSTGASIIGGLGLLGFGAACAGASFVIGSDGYINFGEFVKASKGSLVNSDSNTDNEPEE